jgi:hypothetical protein
MLIKKFIEIFDELDFDYRSVYFGVDENTDEIKIIVYCNDLFYWGCADGEEVTEENIHLIKEAYEKIDSIDWCQTTTLDLFCCMSRQMRPQSPCYYHIEQKYWHLFDECGEEREEEMNRIKYCNKKIKSQKSFSYNYFIIKNGIKNLIHTVKKNYKKSYIK